MSKPKSTLIDQEFLDRCKDFKKKQQEIAKLQKGLAEDVIDNLKTLIKSAPLIEAVRWRQWVPGFNDGEPCLFTLDELAVKFDEGMIAEYGNQENVGKTMKVIESDDDEEEDENSDEFIEAGDVDDFIKGKMDVLNHKEFGLLEKQVEAVYTLFSALEAMEGELQDRFGDNTEVTLTKDGLETEDYDCGY